MFAVDSALSAGDITALHLTQLPITTDTHTQAHALKQSPM